MTLYNDPSEAIRRIELNTRGLATLIQGGTIMPADSIPITFGTSNDAKLVWDTADANANMLKLDLPVGGAVNVPVLAIGIGVAGVDLTFLNGTTEATLAMFNAALTQYVAISNTSFNAPNVDSVSWIGKARDSSIGLVEIIKLVGAADPYIRIGRDDTGVATNAVTDMLVLQAGAGANNEAAGFGLGIAFNIGNAASEVEKRGGIYVKLNTATNGAEDTGMIFQNMVGGALFTTLSLEHTYLTLGRIGASHSIYISRESNTTAGNLVANSNGLIFNHQYWDGAAAVSRVIQIQAIQEDDSPVIDYLKFYDATGTYMRLRNNATALEIDLDQLVQLTTNADLTGSADVVKLGGYDLSAGNRTLAIATETAVAADVVLASTHTLSVRINGATYKILLATP